MLAAVATCVILIPLVCIMIYRTICDGGIVIGKNIRFSNIFVREDDEKIKSFDLVKVAGGALLFRIFIYLVSYLMMVLVYNNEGSFLDWWTKWDAEAYKNIALGGYAQDTLDGVAGLGDGVFRTLVFFPLYPLLAAGVNLIIGNVRIALLATATICFVVACVVLYMAVHHRYGKSVADKAVILTAISPYAFYQGGMLPESTFLLVCSLCMLFTFKKKWWLAGLMGILCALTRLQGVVIIALIGLEWMRDAQVLALIKNKEWGRFGKSLLNLPAVFMPLLGVVAYFGVNVYYTNDPFYFMKLQKAIWGHTYVHIPTGIEKLVNNLRIEDSIAIKYAVWIPELIIFVFVVALLYYAVRKHSIGVSVYLLLYLIISYSSDYVISATRYMSVSVALFVVLAEMCEKRPAVYRMLVTASLMLQVIYMGCHLSGWHLVT